MADIQLNFKADSAKARAEIDLLKKEIGYLREGFKRTQEAADGGGDALQRFRRETTAVTHVFVRSIDAFGGALNQFDRRFLGFHERVDAFTGAIHRLPPEITAVRQGFDVLAPTAGRIASVFADIETSLVDTGAEAESFRRVFEQLGADIEQLEADFERAEFFASFGEIAAHQANLIRPAVSDAVRSMVAYVDVMGSVQGTFETADTLSERLTDSIRDQASAFDELRRSVDGVAQSQSGLQGQQLGSGIFDEFDARTLGIEDRFSFITENADVFGNVAVRVFDEASNEILRTAESIDTVGDSLLAVSDIAARIALGDLTAAIQLPFRINEINAAQDAAALQGRQERRDVAIDERTLIGVRDNNLASVARALGIPIGRFDISEAPHTIQGLQTLNDFSGTDLEDLSRNLLSGRADIAGGILASIERALANTNLDEDIARSITTLAVNLERALTSADIDAIFQPRIDRLREDLNQSSFNLDFAKQTGGDVDTALQDVIRANTALYQQQIDSYNLQRQATGRAIGNVEELNRILNALNNDSRLALASGPQNAQQFLAANNITRGLAAPQDDQERGVVANDAEVAAALETVESRPEVAEDLTSIIEAVETRTANRLAQDALNAISEAASDVNVTEAAIIEKWNEAVPRIEAWWQELYEDLVNNENLTEAERTESFAALGTQQDFVASLKSQYVTPALIAIAQATEALQTRTATRLAQEAINAISEAVSDVNITEETILARWAEALPFLQTWWQELHDDIVNNPNLTDAARTEALAELGSVENFVAGIKSQYVTPVLQGIEQSAEALQTRTANRLAQAAMTAIGEAASDVNVTEETILSLWTAAVPSIRTWWQELYEDIVNNPNLSDAEQTEAFAALGSVDDFVANLKAQHVTPVLSGIMQSAEALQTRTANRLAQAAITAIGEAANDVNITEQAILDLWVASEPLIRTWWQELYEDIVNNPNLSEAEQAEGLAELGSVTDFVAGIKSQYVSPVLMGIAESQEALETRTATRIANEALSAIRNAAEDVNITEEAILTLWTAAGPAIRTWYQELYDDIVNNPNLSDAERTEAVTAFGSIDAFVSHLKSQYVTPVLMGITRTTEALETRTANRLAQNAIKGLGEVASDVNITERAILDKWQEAIPFIRTWWQELYDDIVNNANLTDADIAESLAELGSVEDFVGNIRSQYVTPVLNNILGTQFRNRSNAAQNRVNRAQFNLGGATSESDFETRRGLLIGAINAYYSAEEERIDALELSEAELRDLRQDNQLARDQAIRRATDATNTFEEERLEMVRETQDKIDDLRDDGFEAEADRLASLEDLHARHNARILDLEEDFQENLEDLRRGRRQDAQDLATEYQRDIQDLQNEFARELFGDSVISFADLTAEQQRQLQSNAGFQQERFDLGLERDRDRQDIRTESGVLRAGSAGEAFYRQQIESGELTDTNLIERLFGRRGLDDFISNRRDVEDLEQRTAERTADINAEAEATATALQEVLTPLLNEQSAPSRDLSMAAEAQATAATQQMIAAGALERAATAIEESAVDTFRGIAATTEDTRLREIARLREPTRRDVSMRDVTDLTARLRAAEALSATRELPTSFTADTVNVSGQTVKVSGGSAGEAAPAQPTEPTEITVVSPITLNDNILLETQARTTQLDDALNI